MMSEPLHTCGSETALTAHELRKVYRIWDRPSSRLWVPAATGIGQFLGPRTKLAARIEKRAQRHYRDVHALHDVSFELRRGESLGIIGRNGSGKSTLLQIVAGTLRPTTGNCETHGRVAALLELGSGFNPEFTGRENVFLNGTVLGLSRDQISDRFESIAAFADIGDFIDQPVKTYSSGMQMRLAFSVVAHVDAEILIVDEALAVGDIFFVQKCMRWLKQFQENGTVIFVTHNARDITSLCNRAMWLRDGRVEEIGEPHVVSENYLAYFNQGLGAHVGSGKTMVRIPPKSSEASTSVLRSHLAAVESRSGDFRVLEFDPDAPGYGSAAARITDVSLRSEDDSWVLTTIDGGESVVLHIEAEAVHDLRDVIIGFYIKNRLGQHLFGENTFLTYQEKRVSAPAGSRLVAEFTFEMPLLPRGTYAVMPAIATGDLEQHVQHHWIHEGLVFESRHSYVHRGLVALPMRKISLSTAVSAAS